jgi:hypothetical protein
VFHGPHIPQRHRAILGEGLAIEPFDLPKLLLGIHALVLWRAKPANKI